jgi:hypothetical protein
MFLDDTSPMSTAKGLAAAEAPRKRKEDKRPVTQAPESASRTPKRTKALEQFFLPTGQCGFVAIVLVCWKKSPLNF